MRIGILITLIFLFTKSLQGQCPGRDFLWHRITYLRDSSKVPYGQQLNELLSYFNKTNQCPGNKDSTQVLLLQRIGWLHSLVGKDFFTAIRYTNKSIDLVNGQKNSPGIRPTLAIKSYWNLKILYDSLKLESKKTAALDSCISMALALRGGYEYALPALALRVQQLFENGDYFRCIDYAKLGESLVQENRQKIKDAEYFENQYFTWKINSLSFLKKSADAEKLIGEKIQQSEKQKNTESLGALYGVYGQIKKDKGESEKAIYYFEKSFFYNKKINHADGCAEALNNIGLTYSEMYHQHKKALGYHFRALSFANPNESLNILDNISNIYLQSNNYDSAFYFFQKAFDQIRVGFTEAELLKNSNELERGRTTEYISGMVLDKADGYLQKYKTTGQTKALMEAIRIYQAADLFFDKIKETQAEIQSKLSWKANNRRLYEHAIEACYAIQNKEKAFYFFEKSRSVLLNDQIMEQRRMADDDLAKQAQLKKTLLDIERDLQNTPASSKENLALRQKILINNQEQAILIKNINSKNPSFKQNYSDTSSLTIELVRTKILGSGKSLLEIFTGDSAVYVLSVTAGNTSFIKLDKRLYDGLTTAYISFITNPEKLNQDFAGFVNASHLLYDLVFQKVQLQTGGSLIISPDGRSFPFEALVTNTDFRKPDYLLHHFATSYTYSARYLANEYASNEDNRGSVLGMAPVKYKSSFGLAELPGSDLSLQKIKDQFSDATNFVFQNATKNNFLQHFADYAVIQLYTHAADSSTRNDPVIYFSDSALYLSELIADRKPITQLVVLSACETANGKLYQGEGIFSFNRGFAALGIPAAVSNLWSVDNESTYRITELFYKYLSQGLPTDIALQKAKLEFINNTSSKENQLPYFWAGCILTGKVDIIKSNNSILWIGLGIAVLLLLCAVYFTRKIILQQQRINKPADFINGM